MILLCPLFHVAALFCLELLALTAAVFLFLYIKKENFNKWFSFAAAAIMGLVLLTMAASFVGAICMHCHGGKEECREEKRMIFRHEMGRGMEMGMEGMNPHERVIRIEGDCPEGMEGCKNMGECGKSGMEGCEMTKGCEMECCKGKKDGQCDMKEMKENKMTIKKDTVIVKKKH
jgi:hypothetical protein